MHPGGLHGGLLPRLQSVVGLFKVARGKQHGNTFSFGFNYRCNLPKSVVLNLSWPMDHLFK